MTDQPERLLPMEQQSSICTRALSNICTIFENIAVTMLAASIHLWLFLPMFFTLICLVDLVFILMLIHAPLYMYIFLMYTHISVPLNIKCDVTELQRLNPKSQTMC